jgi:hypothetical protein
MKRNVELLERVMTYIEDHPDEHKQAFWFTMGSCGTAACFAGHAALLSGYQPAGNSADGWRRDCQLPGERPKPTSFVARELLGLTEEEGRTLFADWITRPMLKLMVKDLCNGDPLRFILAYKEEAHQ